MKLVAKTFEGLEELLKSELEALGAKEVEAIKRAVKFEGSKEVMYRANLEARTALRILQPLFAFKISDQEQFYHYLSNYPWHEIMHEQDTFAIDCVSRSHVFRHSKFAVYRAKDAIVDYFRKRTNERPSIDIDNPKYRFHYFIKNQDVTVYLDSSGSSLHLRGYRKHTGPAPLNEVLAAGMIKLSDWDQKRPFIDPMCGSGTLLIEAASIAGNTPVNIHRTFNFMQWKDFDANLWASIKKNALDAVRSELPIIIGCDSDAKVLRMAQRNIENIRAGNKIQLFNEVFAEFEPKVEEATLIFNPPYEIRMTTGDILEFYRMIGDTLKKKYAGCSAWFISANFEAMKSVGLKTSRKIPLFNGANECRFLQFKMYKGTLSNKNDQEID